MRDRLQVEEISRLKTTNIVYDIQNYPLIGDSYGGPSINILVWVEKLYFN
jgi:hypothetical protein